MVQADAGVCTVDSLLRTIKDEGSPQAIGTMVGGGCSPPDEVGQLRASISSAKRMAFLALGINHKTASVDVRERVAFTPEQLVEALQQLCQRTSTREAAILSTCNRSELYLEQDSLTAEAVLAWLADYHKLSLDELRACAYIHEDDAAVRHMMRVASGLDSMVLGEPQILGQMKSAYAVAREAEPWGRCSGVCSRPPSAPRKPCAPIPRSARTRFRWPLPR